MLVASEGDYDRLLPLRSQALASCGVDFGAGVLRRVVALRVTDLRGCLPFASTRSTLAPRSRAFEICNERFGEMETIRRGQIV